MWLLLAVAGAGYLARCWQNSHKVRPLTSGCGQNPRTSPSSSGHSTPRRSMSLSNTFCHNSSSISGGKLLYDLSGEVLSNFHENGARPSLDVVFEYENGEGSKTNERSNSDPNICASEQDTECHQHSCDGKPSELLPETCNSSVILLQLKTDIPDDSCSTFSLHASYLDPHTKNMEEISGTKECVCYSWDLPPSYQISNKKRSARDSNLVPSGFDVDSPLDKRIGKDKKCDAWPILNGGDASIDKLRELVDVKQAFTFHKEESCDFLWSPSALVSNSPKGQQSSSVQDIWSKQLEERQRSKDANANVYGQTGFIFNAGKGESIHTENNKETRQNLSIVSEDHVYHRRPSITPSTSQGLGTPRERVNDIAAECALQSHAYDSGSKIHENTKLLHDRGSRAGLWHKGGKRTRGNLQRKKKDPQKFLRGRGPLKKSDFQDPLKYTFSIESCESAHAMHAICRDSFLTNVPPSVVLQPPVFLNLCPVTESNLGSSLAVPSVGFSAVTENTNDRSSLSVFNNERIRAADRPIHSNGKMQYNCVEAESEREAIDSTEIWNHDLLPPLLDHSTDDNLMRETIQPLHTKDNTVSKNAHNSGHELLFGFGVGIAVLLSSSCKNEMERMGRVLKDTEDLVFDMRKELESRKTYMRPIQVGAQSKNHPSDHTMIVSQDIMTKESSPKFEGFSESICKDDLSDDDDSAQSVLTEEHVQDDCHISDLEAELEAELERMEFHMHSRGSSKLQPYPEDITPVKSCGSNHEFSSTYKEINMTDYMVSAVELERRLWEVLQQKQEERIMEIERALELTERRLYVKEREIQWWKDRVRWLTELSFGENSGEGSVKKSMEGVYVSTGNSEMNSFKGHETMHFEPEFLESEASCSVEGSTEVVERRAGGRKGLELRSVVRTGSAFSFSSEESFLSLGLSSDIVASSCPMYNGSRQPANNNRLNLYSVGDLPSENPSLHNHLSRSEGVRQFKS